ncbi:hypothetical protein GPECTOR_1g14 [Gonium pectorale]|uniref:Uncharacterized protein n=1 Tax=Gonium pectorale TaxID=33097 RepID=A0A150H2C1_GONPE|nr:hypothetical protein GPECTOR_1g14 [Gonium pectorale]|eukprot:KXZ56163.1 hypothetical protein GPECTOR_1g14 [Gonium pectorale]
MGKGGKAPAENGNNTLRGMLESLFWTAAACLVVVYGSGKHDLVTLLLTDERVNRMFLALGIINMFFNGCLFAYVYIWLGYVWRVRDPARSGTLAIPAGAVTFATTIVSPPFARVSRSRPDV